MLDVTDFIKKIIFEKLVVSHLVLLVFGTERLSTVITMAVEEPYADVGESSL